MGQPGKRRFGRISLLLAMSALVLAGCKSISSSRSGVTSIEPADGRSLSVRQGSTAPSAKADADAGVVPANYNRVVSGPEAGGECRH
jgi:hypothetical protein